MIAPEPFVCAPLTDELLEQYEELVGVEDSEKLRAWIRETDKVCRANKQLLKEIS